MTRVSNPLWAARDDYAAASTAIKVGAFAAFAEACVAVALAAIEYWRNGFDVASVALPAFLGILAAIAAVRILSGSGAAAQAALVLWVILGLLPTDLSLWVAVSILIGLVAGVRGAHVLAKLQSTN